MLDIFLILRYNKIDQSFDFNLFHGEVIIMHKLGEFAENVLCGIVEFVVEFVFDLVGDLLG